MSTRIGRVGVLEVTRFGMGRKGVGFQLTVGSNDTYLQFSQEQIGELAALLLVCVGNYDEKDIPLKLEDFRSFTRGLAQWRGISPDDAGALSSSVTQVVADSPALQKWASDATGAP